VASHDAFDWFVAIGPTLAAAAAAWATWKTAQVAKQISVDGLALQRSIARPVIVVRSRIRIDRGEVGLHVAVHLENMGQSAANIELLRILVDGNEVTTGALEPPNEFWTRVITMVVPGMRPPAISGHVIRPAFALSAKEIQPLLDVQLEGDTTELHRALQTLAIDVEYKASWGERWSLRTVVADPSGT
jgi:hypothetical protein